MIILGIFVAGGLGSVLRVLLSKFNGFWPWGILLANAVASFFASENRKSFWGSGFAGGLTTMSAVALFVYQQGSVAITAVMFALGFFAFAAGVSLGKKKAGLNELG